MITDNNTLLQSPIFGRRVALASAVISFLARRGEIMSRIITSPLCLVNCVSLQLQPCPMGQFRTPEENLCRGVWNFWFFEYSDIFCYIEALNRGTQRLFSVKYIFGEFYIVWRRLKIFRWPFRLCTIFEAYLINPLRFSKVKFFTFHTPG